MREAKKFALFDQLVRCCCCCWQKSGFLLLNLFDLIFVCVCVTFCYISMIKWISLISTTIQIVKNPDVFSFSMRSFSDSNKMFNDAQRYELNWFCDKCWRWQIKNAQIHTNPHWHFYIYIYCATWIQCAHKFLCFYQIDTSIRFNINICPSIDVFRCTDFYHYPPFCIEYSFSYVHCACT